MDLREIKEIKIELSTKLQALKSKFPYHERMKWCVENEYSLKTVDRYLDGFIGSIPVAQVLLKGIEKFIDSKNSIAA